MSPVAAASASWATSDAPLSRNDATNRPIASGVEAIVRRRSSAATSSTTAGATSGIACGRLRTMRVDEGDRELFGADRLGQVTVHASGQAGLAVALHGVGRHGDDVDVAARRPDATCRFEAIHLGHLHVHQDEVVRQRRHSLDGFEPVRGNVGAVAHRLQHEQRDLLVHGVVLRQQDAQRMALTERLGVDRGDDFGRCAVGQQRHEDVEELGLLDRLGEHRGEHRVEALGPTERGVENERE